MRVPKTALPGVSSHPADLSRRGFLRQPAMGAAVATAFPFVNTGRAQPDQPIRIAVVGCGGRGTGAALDAVGAATNVIYPNSGYHTEDAAQGSRASAANVQILALADLFPDRLAQ